MDQQDKVLKPFIEALEEFAELHSAYKSDIENLAKQHMSAEPELRAVAGELGRGDCENWWLFGVEGTPCAACADALVSKVSCTACSIVSNIS